MVSPNHGRWRGIVILGLTFILALIFGMGLAVWLDRRKAGGYDKDDLAVRTGISR
jgi:hypothetical protein